MIASLCRPFLLEGVGTMQLAYRMLVSSAWPEGYDGRYYWQHCSWVDSDDWSSNTQMALDCFTAMEELYTSQVRFHAHRFYLPGTETVEFQQTFGSVFVGDLSPVENPTLLIVARWRMIATDGSKSYHLHRRPIGEEDLSGGGWDPDGYARQQLALNNYVDHGFFRAPSGAVLDAGLVAEVPVMWQLRHGTKRRERRGWLV